MRILFQLLFLLLCPVVLIGQTPAEKFEAQAFALKSGYKLPYRLLKPEKIEPGKTYPVVLFLHGAGERGSNNTSQVKNGAELFINETYRKKYPCFVVVPQCPANSFWGYTSPQNSKDIPDQPLNAALSLLDQVIKENPVDKHRVYLIGLSMGGYATFRSLEARPKFFAAAIPICGGGYPQQVKEYKRVPLWIFHGEKDPVVSPENSKKMAEALKAVGSKPKLTLFPNVAHDAWTPALNNPETWEWLFEQKR
jgi:predicted peptidase